MKLVAAKCPECGTGLAPANDDFVVACRQCATAVRLGEHGVTAVSVQFAARTRGSGPDDAAARDDVAVTRWVPVWVFDGRVYVVKRQAAGLWDRDAAMESNRFWANARRFYVPAWELTLDAVKSVGIEMIERQTQFWPVSRPPRIALAPAVISDVDARKLLDFMILSIEARRWDLLKELDYRLKVKKPELWALPEQSALRGRSPGTSPSADRA